jgi:hypothetical protein
MLSTEIKKFLKECLLDNVRENYADIAKGFAFEMARFIQNNGDVTLEKKAIN